MYPHSGLSFSLAHPSLWNLQHWIRTLSYCPIRLSSLHALCLGHIFFSLAPERQTYRKFILHMSSVFVTCMNEISDLYSISGPQKAMLINWSNLQWRVSDWEIWGMDANCSTLKLLEMLSWAPKMAYSVAWGFIWRLNAQPGCWTMGLMASPE